MLLNFIITGFITSLAGAQSTSTTFSSASYRETVTETAYSIIPSDIEDVSWLSSLNSKYFTDGHTWTGSRVPVFTSLYSLDGNRTETGLAYLETGILDTEGYDIVSSAITVTECAMSPTGIRSEAECTPHHDHWHCPPGVKEPPHPPEEHQHGSDIPEPAGTECVYHVNHWHCAEGVPEPISDPKDASESQSSGQAGVGVGVTVAHHNLFALAIALLAANKLLA